MLLVPNLHCQKYEYRHRASLKNFRLWTFKATLPVKENKQEHSAGRDAKSSPVVMTEEATKKHFLVKVYFFSSLHTNLGKRGS